MLTNHYQFGDQEAREKTDHLPLLAKAKDIDVAITTSTSKGSLKVLLFFNNSFVLLLLLFFLAYDFHEMLS